MKGIQGELRGSLAYQVVCFTITGHVFSLKRTVSFQFPVIQKPEFHPIVSSRFVPSEIHARHDQHQETKPHN